MHDCRIFDLQTKSDDINPMITDHKEILQMHIEDFSRALLRLIIESDTVFKYSSSENLIYSIIEING